MKIFVALISIVAVSTAVNILITKENTEKLKSTVGWNVMDYDENPFRGWTVEEASNMLQSLPEDNRLSFPVYESDIEVPKNLDWRTGSCVHSVRDQGSCTSCYAFAVAGMISDRCCLKGKDHGWLSPQELVSCDKTNYGCGGGWAAYSVNYLMKNGGLVHNACFPYVEHTEPCKGSCKDGRDWSASHVCNCTKPVHCVGQDNILKCLNSGPVALTLEVCQSFYYYKAGSYKCDCKSNIIGLQTVTAVGYTNEDECVLMARNSWGNKWGNEGFFNISCESCGIDGKYQQGNIMCDISS